MSNVKGGLGGIVRQAQKMQQQIARVQETMAGREVEATAGGGAVVAVVNGKHELLKLTIAPEVIEEGDVEIVQELVMTAINLAMENAQEMVQTEVNKITGGLSIPGLI